MKTSLVVGVATTSRLTVDRERTIDLAGGEARVYATPMLVRDIETACRKLLLRHLDPGEDTLCTHVELDHLAVTPAGMPVELTVTVVVLEGRMITLEVSGRDVVDLICRGRQRRFVVDVKAAEARLAAKAQTAAVT